MFVIAVFNWNVKSLRLPTCVYRNRFKISLTALCLSTIGSGIILDNDLSNLILDFKSF